MEAQRGLHISWWDQLHVMPQLDQFPCPMVAGSTGLDADQTRLKAFKECQHFCPSQSAIECNLAMLINTVDLKNFLSQI